jgi:galactokinase
MNANSDDQTPTGDSAAIDTALPLPELLEQTRAQFRANYSTEPRWIAAAPGRVNMIGEHTDYNDGFVLPMAIERYVVMAAAPSDCESNGAEFRLASSMVEQEERFPLGMDDWTQLAPWARYVYGVMVGCRDRGMEWGPLKIAVNSNVPLGGGLSSSAALEVATATLLEAVTGASMDKIEKALLCQKAEHEYAGVPCGIMDQFTSVLGEPDHLMLLDCRSTEVQMVPLNDSSLSVLIINTNVKHELTGGEYAERRGQCEQAARQMGVPSLRDATMETLNANAGSLESILVRRARHVIGEIERTTDAATGFADGEWARVGKLMYDSHASLRDDYEVSCPELDLLVDLARKHGDSGAVIGSRMTGGGFGGCTVSLVHSDQVETIASAIRDDYHRETGILPSLFTTRPAPGAQIIS